MREAGPSRTAASVAFRRAAHQIIDKPPVFVDPLARAVLSPEGQNLLDTNPWRGNQGGWSFLRAFVAVRSRVAEDQVAEAVARGVKQYVVLGAGLDTFAYRNPFPELRVFEVDHPRTQTWKLERLKAAGLADAPHVTHVPVDFESQTVAHELEAHGFDAAAATAISWLGVLPYLEEPTVWATLTWARSVAGERGHIVFDYGDKPRWWQFGKQLAQRRLAKRVAAAGEPFRTRLRPEYLRQRLTEIGFASVDDMDGAELNRRYFMGRTDRLRVGGGRVVVASRAT